MSFLTPILVVIAVWLIGTGLVLFLQQSIKRVRGPLIVSLAVVSVLSLAGLYIGGSGTQPWHSYLGFVAAICLWGSIELSYYSGLIGGVHKRACPDDCDTGKRFRLALGASIWHEVSVLFVGGVVMTLLIQAQNSAGLYSFLVLWLMRWSAKLNLFLGVPNFNTDWFPKRLAYAHSYIRRAPVTLFFPVSVALASLVAMQLIITALETPAQQALMHILPGVLLLLAILEHIFMALPIADSELWNRIFSRDDEADNNSQDDDACANEDAGLPMAASKFAGIQSHTPERELRALGASTNTSVSVTLQQVEATATQSVNT